VSDERVQVLDAAAGPELPIVESGGRAHAVVWPGVGAELRSMHRIALDAGGATVELHHPSEAVYYVVGGSGEVIDPGEGSATPIRPGSMVHADPGSAYRFRAGPEGLELVGGPSPPDPALYEGG
jgi:mannose-6-phosphate isomerase-like protein (cupin superfamily)